MPKSKQRKTLPLRKWTRTLRIALKNARERRQQQRRES